MGFLPAVGGQERHEPDTERPQGRAGPTREEGAPVVTMASHDLEWTGMPRWAAPQLPEAASRLGAAADDRAAP